MCFQVLMKFHEQVRSCIWNWMFLVLTGNSINITGIHVIPFSLWSIPTVYHLISRKVRACQLLTSHQKLPAVFWMDPSPQDGKLSIKKHHVPMFLQYGPKGCTNDLWCLPAHNEQPECFCGVALLAKNISSLRFKELYAPYSFVYVYVEMLHNFDFSNPGFSSLITFQVLFSHCVCLWQ